MTRAEICAEMHAGQGKAGNLVLKNLLERNGRMEIIEDIWLRKPGELGKKISRLPGNWRRIAAIYAL